MLLTPKTLAAIKQDVELGGMIARELGFGFQSLERAIRHNDPRLTQAGVLRILRDHLNETDETLLTEKK